MSSTLHAPGIDLTICGLDELCDHGTRGVSHVLSILDPGWPDPADFERYDPHHRLTLRFHDIIAEYPGYEAPQPEHVEALIRYGEELQGAGEGALRHLLIHCHAGVSRSTAAMAILLTQHAPGQERRVFERLVAIRPQAWPNSRMIGFADELLGRRGRLVDALREHYHRQAAARPDLAEVIRRSGREAEIPG
ncbi:MAG TPA: hypothetical protein VFG43_01275 [Geminicoccaceae bacterium]|nr:hypothetical protein [Geminicoccaceae bacterium]